MLRYEFDAPIVAVDGIDGAYVEVPYNLPKTFGMERMKMHASFDGEPYAGSIVSSKSNGETKYIIGITKAIRESIHKSAGDVVHVSFTQRQIEGSAWTYWQLFVKKLEAKGKGEAELQVIASWLLGYTKDELCEEKLQLDYIEWFEAAPKVNPLASLIGGKICGFAVAEIEDPTMQRMRQLDKLVDDMAKGKKKVFPA